MNRCVLRILLAAGCAAGILLTGGCGISGLADVLWQDGEAPELRLDEPEDTDTEEQQTGESAEPEPEPAYSFLNDTADTYARDRLTETERLWYEDIAETLGCMTSVVSLDEAGISAELDETDIERIFQCVMMDHPELFYVNGYRYTKYTHGGRTYAIDFEGSYELDTETALAREEEIEQAAEAFLAEVPDGDDYTRVMYLYEKIIRDTDYDLDAPDNQNIYSVLVGGASVCQGYAKTMQYLANRLGIECTLVIGTVSNGEKHAWNLMRMDGEYYYVDPTWGDISYQTQETEYGDVGHIAEVSYDYFGVTTAQLQLTHTPECEVELPECTAQEDNYFVREGALFETYDRTQLQQLMDDALAEGRKDIALRCADEDCYREMKAALIESGEIFTYLPEDSQTDTFAYTLNEQLLSFTFFLVEPTTS